jgi:hypothetical protein
MREEKQPEHSVVLRTAFSSLYKNYLWRTVKGPLLSQSYQPFSQENNTIEQIVSENLKKQEGGK